MGGATVGIPLPSLRHSLFLRQRACLQDLISVGHHRSELRPAEDIESADRPTSSSAFAAGAGASVAVVAVVGKLKLRAQEARADEKWRRSGTKVSTPMVMYERAFWLIFVPVTTTSHDK